MKRDSYRHALEAAAIAAVAVALMTVGPLRQLTLHVLDRVTVLIATWPVAGKIVFFLASAASAMLAFFSSAVVVPAAVYAWGPRTTVVLLWLAWLAGGCATYAIGRSVGQRVASWLISREKVAFYAARISASASVPAVLLFQIALPSEVPGYVLGTVLYPFPRYLLALAIAELPFAIGAVYLGDSFVRGDYLFFLAIGAAGLLLSILALRRLRRVAVT